MTTPTNVFAPGAATTNVLREAGREDLLANPDAATPVSAAEKVNVFREAGLATASPTVAPLGAPVIPATDVPDGFDFDRDVVGPIKEFFVQAGHAIPTVGKGLGANLGTTAAIAQMTDAPTAARSMWYGLRANWGFPMTPEEEQGIASAFAKYNAGFPGSDPLNIGESLRELYAPIPDEKAGEAAQGLVNIVSSIVPAGPTGRVATSALRGLGVKAPQLTRMGAQMAHALASGVTWGAGTAVVEGERDPVQIAEAAAEAGGVAATFPPVMKGVGVLGGKAANGAFRATATTLTHTSKPVREAIAKTQVYRTVRNFAERRLFRPGVLAGDMLLEKYGVTDTGRRLKAIRQETGFLSGGWLAESQKALEGLTDRAVYVVGEALHQPNEFKVRALAETRGLDPDIIWNAARRVSAQLQDAGNQATDANVIVRQGKHLYWFQKRQDFGMPHVFVDMTKHQPGGELFEESIKKIMDATKKSRKWAENELADIVEFHNNPNYLNASSPSKDTFYAHSMLRGRQYNLSGFEIDPRKVLPSYYETMARKIAASKHFGAMELVKDTFGGGVKDRTTDVRDIFPYAFDEARALLKAGKIDNAEHKVIQAVIADQLGATDLQGGGALIEGLLKASSINIPARLGLSQIAQLSQFGDTIALAGYRNSWKALGAVLGRDPEAHAMFVRSGAAMQAVARASRNSMFAGRETTAGGRIVAHADKTLHDIGLTQLDSAARKFSALSGFHMAEEAGKRMTQLLRDRETVNAFQQRLIDKEIAKIERRFVALDIKPEKVLANRGYLDDSDILKAMQKVSTDVNFWGDALSLPAYWRTPWGRFATQFKSFIFQHTRFVHEAFVKPAIRDDDWTPLLRFLLTQQITGEVVGDIREAVKSAGGAIRPYGEGRSTDAGERLLNNWVQAAAFGIPGDVITASNYGVGLVEQGIGPSIGGFAQLGDAGVQALSGHPRTFAKELAGLGVAFIPRVGPLLVAPTREFVKTVGKDSGSSDSNRRTTGKR